MKNKITFRFRVLSTLVFGLKKRRMCAQICARDQNQFFPYFWIFFLQFFVVQLLHDDDEIYDENEANFVHKVGPNFSFEFIEAKIV